MSYTLTEREERCAIASDCPGGMRESEERVTEHQHRRRGREIAGAEREREQGQQSEGSRAGSVTRGRERVVCA